MIDGGERLLRRVLHIPLHFEARDQFDIAGGAVYAGFPVAQRFIAGTKSYPFRLKLVARLRLLVRAPFLLLLRAELALPRDIEFRRGVRDRGGMQGSQNNDRQVNQHFYSPSCFVIQSAREWWRGKSSTSLRALIERKAPWRAEVLVFERHSGEQSFL